MNKPNRNDEALYRTVEQIAKETNLCKGKVRELAKEAESIIRIGRAVRINASKFYEYLEREYGC